CRVRPCVTRSRSSRANAAPTTWRSAGLLLLREQRVQVAESLELQGVAGGIEDEERGLLARLTLEADARLDHPARRRLGAQPLGQGTPGLHVQHDTEVRHRHVLAVDGAARLSALLVARVQVRDDLMAE